MKLVLNENGKYELNEELGVEKKKALKIKKEFMKSNKKQIQDIAEEMVEGIEDLLKQFINKKFTGRLALDYFETVKDMINIDISLH